MKKIQNGFAAHEERPTHDLVVICSVISITTRLFLLSSFFSSSYALAQVAVSTTTSKPSSISVTYFGNYRVASVFKENTYKNGTVQGPLAINTLFLNYDFRPNQFFGVVLNYWLQPVTMAKSTVANPAIRVGDRKFISTQFVNLSSDFQVLLPVSEEARLQKQIIGFGSQDLLTVRFDRSNFFIDSFAVARFLTFTQKESGRAFHLFNRTGFNYQITQSFGLGMGTILLSYIENRSTPRRLQMEDPRVGPGAFWTFKNFKFNTYLTLNAIHPSIKETAFLGLLSAKLF